MAKLTLRVRDLMMRTPSYRWLWANHDEVAEFLKDHPTWAWARLTLMARSAGVERATREAVRGAWRKVAVDWERAGPELRSADVSPENRTKAAAPRVESAPIQASVRERPEILPPSGVPAEDDSDGRYHFKTMGRGQKTDG